MVATTPLVCVCDDPETDELGECRQCHRKPLFLLPFDVDDDA